MGEKIYINPYKLFVGSFVPNWIKRRSEISQGAKLCYAELARHAGKTGKAWPGLDVLADDLGVTIRQIARYIEELKQYDLIEVYRRGLMRSNGYRFVLHSWMGELRKKGNSMSDQDRTSMSDQDKTDTSDEIGHKRQTRSDIDVRSSKGIEKSLLKESLKRDARAREERAFQKKGSDSEPESIRDIIDRVAEKINVQGLRAK